MKGFIVLCTLLIILPAQATVFVYTDEASWQADAELIADHYHDNFLGWFSVAGDPGNNDFILSGNSMAFQGQVIDGVTEPSLYLADLDYSTFAVGGHWTITPLAGDAEPTLFMEVQGTVIPMAPNILGAGDFLGIITDTFPGYEYRLQLNFTGNANFLFNNTRIYVVPVPAALWLFGSALIGLAGFGYRHRAS